jgi:pimeloyl-ACP methyl ester carboxylesterase
MFLSYNFSVYNIVNEATGDPMSDYTFSSISIVKINPHRFRNILLISLALLLLISAASSASAAGGIKVIHDPSSAEVYPFSRNTLASFSSVSFFSSDESVLLKGWFFKSENSKKLMLFVHDYSQNRTVFGEDTDRVINNCLKEGYNVLLFDLRNSGNVSSSKATAGLNEAYDVEGALLYASALDMREIYIIGFGTGANAVLNAEKPENVKGIVLDSPYFRFSNALKFIYEQRNIKTFFFTKTFSIFFLRLFDKAKRRVYDKDYFKALPPILISRSGFSYLGTNEEKRMHDAISSYSDNISIMAAFSSGSDTKEYLELVFNFFDEYTMKGVE